MLVSPRRDVSMTQAEMAAFFATPRTGVLSSLGADGYPHSVAMWFVPDLDGDRGELHMWAYGRSQKVVNLERDPRCAFMVEEGRAYNELRGLLVRGEARIVTDVEATFEIGRRLYESYTLPATGVPAAAAEEELRRQAGKRKGIVLPLKRVASWDHSKL